MAKAEQIEGKENPRYVVTNLPAERWAAQVLYEELYCARGEMENRIKEQLSLFAARVSAETMRANQLRLSLRRAFPLFSPKTPHSFGWSLNWQIPTSPKLEPAFET